MQRNLNELASYNLARQTAMEVPTEATEGQEARKLSLSATNKSSLNRNIEGKISYFIASVEPPVVLLCINCKRSERIHTSLTPAIIIQLSILAIIYPVYSVRASPSHPDVSVVYTRECYHNTYVLPQHSRF